ncbi:cell wall-associated hydrolase [Caulobacter phage C1]|nr:cell wall-associated hydrolase [Caulobacter phage C1]UTU08386.1 cell wall-associated hydrolase [Caulobacter phage C2]UTU08903.1 cell wall-associated hydrolase [Caulobacter phage J4]UTU09459.1 cell wall-associated hydrolase [Caulobacter phage BL47]UTU10019.1 cell wall-associated hydrolase [Caulobacter phage RB23]WGN97054.1 cell wall-associated hydrolase [Bertelyvirus sp.]
MRRQEIIDEARRYVAARTRWRPRGRSIQAVDCIGLVACVGTAFGVPYEDIDGYSQNPDGRFVDHIRKFMIYRDPQTVVPGCAVIFNDNHQACHIGIIGERYGQRSLIHASLAQRQVVEEEYDGHWTSRFRCALDFPGVED